MQSWSFPQCKCILERTQESSHRKNYANQDTLQHAFTCTGNQLNLQTPYKFAIATIHTRTNTRASRSRTRKGLPHFTLSKQCTASPKMQPKTRFSFQERTTTWTRLAPHRRLPFHSREADRLAEQPQEQRPLEHEDRVQVRPVQREPEHRDPGSVVLQVRHCNANEAGRSSGTVRQQQQQEEW
jgi:hypothetical protein